MTHFGLILARSVGVFLVVVAFRLFLDLLRARAEHLSPVGLIAGLCVASGCAIAGAQILRSV